MLSFRKFLFEVRRDTLDDSDEAIRLNEPPFRPVASAPGVYQEPDISPVPTSETDVDPRTREVYPTWALPRKAGGGNFGGKNERGIPLPLNHPEHVRELGRYHGMSGMELHPDYAHIPGYVQAHRAGSEYRSNLPRI